MTKTAKKSKGTGTAAYDTPPGELRRIPLALIDPNPHNPRGDISDADVADLVASFREHGQLQPIVVSPTEGGRFVITGGGHRRRQAHLVAGNTEAECLVRPDLADDGGVALIIENLQRKDIDPLDEARAFRRLVDSGWSQERIAEAVGCAQSHVSKRLALLKLPDKVLAKVGADVTIAEALKLASVADDQEVLDVALKRSSVFGGTNAHAPIDRAVEVAIAEVKGTRARDKKIEKLKAQGVNVITDPRKLFNDNQYKHQVAEHSYSGIEMKPEKHAKEACHAAYVEAWGGDVRVIYYCLEPKRHKKPKKVDSAEEQRKREERERAANVAAAMTQRRDFVRALLTRRLPRDTVATILVRGHLTRRPYDNGTWWPAAADLLAVPFDSAQKWRLVDNARDAVLNSAIAEERVALSIALAPVEAHLSDKNDRAVHDPHPVVQYLDLLIDNGYALTEFEQLEIEAARAVLAKEAAERAEREAHLAANPHCRDCKVTHQEASDANPPIAFVQPDLCADCVPDCAGQLHDNDDVGHAWDAATCLTSDEPAALVDVAPHDDEAVPA